MDFECIDFNVTESEMDHGVKIKIIGVGGAGGNMVNHIIQTCQFAANVDVMIANTDIQDINRSKANTKIQLGPKKTNGRGAGANPEVGRISAEEVEDEIREKLQDTELLFIAEGLGGGTGTGAGPVIARIAKSMNILVVSVAIYPFSYEKSRIKVADAGLEELKKESDCVILIQNDKLRMVVPKELNARQANEFTNNVLVNAVTGIIKMLQVEADTNIDFSDVTSVMSHRGTALMGLGTACGDNSVEEAYNNALESPLLEAYATNLQDAKAMIVFFSYGSNVPFYQIIDIMDKASSSGNSELEVFYGNVLNEELEPDRVEVTIIATGFDETRNEKAKIEEENKKLQDDLLTKQREVEVKKVSGGLENKIDYKNCNFDEPAFVRWSQD